MTITPIIDVAMMNKLMMSMIMFVTMIAIRMLLLLMMIVMLLTMSHQREHLSKDTMATKSPRFQL